MESIQIQTDTSDFPFEEHLLKVLKEEPDHGHSSDVYCLDNMDIEQPPVADISVQELTGVGECPPYKADPSRVEMKCEPVDDNSKDANVTDVSIKMEPGERESEYELEEPLFVGIKEEPNDEISSHDAAGYDILESSDSTKECVEDKSNLQLVNNILNISCDNSEPSSLHHCGERSSSKSALRNVNKHTISRVASPKALNKQKGYVTNKKIVPFVISSGPTIEMKTNSNKDNTSDEEMVAESERAGRDVIKEERKAQVGEGSQSRERNTCSSEVTKYTVRVVSLWCDICNKYFQSKSQLKDHMCAPVSEIPGEKPYVVKSGLNVHTHSHMGVRPFKCSVCGKAFVNCSLLRRHKVVHSGEKPFNCSVCKRAFSDRTSLVRHMFTHTVGNAFKCSECEKSYSTKSSLDVHTRSHTGERPFGCSVCGKAFNHSSYLKTHMRQHTGEKPFKCSVCQKAFTEKGKLSKHMRTHTGEKPFSCSECKKAFTRKCSLVVHMVAHTGEKPFKCSLCEKAFVDKTALKRHMHNHTGERPFQCSVCGKRFTQGSILSKHKMLHTGEKPFSCSVCKRAFTRKSILVRHLRCHTGEKPFKCSVCGRAFAQTSDVRRHMRTHT